MTTPSPIPEDRFELLGRLGDGGMGEVWLARDRVLGVRRAIKTLQPAMAAHARTRSRFLREARVMAALSHPHVVVVHDYGENPHGVWIVMEYLPGGCLQSWLQRNGPMPPGMALHAIDGVLAALEAAHARGVVHRDVKPANVLVAESGTVKVTDFGIAVMAGDPTLTRSGAPLGTLAYMAPEQRESAHDVDGRADLYAVAGTLYTLLTADRPSGLGTADRQEALLARVPPPLVPIIRRATRFDPQDRYGSATELRAALAAARDALPPLPPAAPALWQPPVHEDPGEPGEPGATEPGQVPSGVAPPSDPGAEVAVPRYQVQAAGPDLLPAPAQQTAVAPRSAGSQTRSLPGSAAPVTAVAPSSVPPVSPGPAAVSVEPPASTSPGGEAGPPRPWPRRASALAGFAALAAILAWFTVPPDGGPQGTAASLDDPTAPAPEPPAPEPPAPEAPAPEAPAPEAPAPEPAVNQVVADRPDSPDVVVPPVVAVSSDPSPSAVPVPEPVPPEAPVEAPGRVVVNMIPAGEVRLVDPPEGVPAVTGNPWSGALPAGRWRFQLATHDGRRASLDVDVLGGRDQVECWDFTQEAPCGR